MEKIHGSSAHIALRDGQLNFSSGGESHDRFVKIFSTDLQKNMSLYGYDVVIYGEVYGGKCQKMSETYGNVLRFVMFDAKVAGIWLSLPEVVELAENIGIEFVHYEEISTDLESIDAQRDADSVQAVRNCMGSGHKREGVVLRPLIELMSSSGERIITKHKRDDFKETATPRVVGPTPEVLSEAHAIATEWVTTTRLQHVLDKIEGERDMKLLGVLIPAMTEDVYREGEGEIVKSKEASKAIRAKTVSLFKEFLNNNIKESK